MNLKTILEELSTRILTDEGVEIDITNIATLNDGDQFLASASPIVLSIVNIEEDKTLRNQSVYLNKTTDFVERYEHPTKQLIVSLLFTSYSHLTNKYLDGLDKLNNVIVFFQKNTSLYFKNAPLELIRYKIYQSKTDVEQSQYSKITFETVSLSMDQVNQMWSYLGSRYMPSILVKMRLIEIQNEKDAPGDLLIKTVKIDVWENNKNDQTGLLETVVHP